MAGLDGPRVRGDGPLQAHLRPAQPARLRPRRQQASHRRRGVASEAAAALVAYAFAELRLARVVATTERENVASIGVMRRLGMRIEENPEPEPAWFQVVGILERDAGKIPRSTHPREGD